MTEHAEIAPSPSPFHPGEKAAQARLGVSEQVERFGSRVIRDFMPDQHREFYRQLPFIFVGHADDKGWPWASILLDKPGFITSSDARTLDIEALPVSGDPLLNSLQQGTRLGLLGIELPSRRRNRLAAHIVQASKGHMRLAIDQAFGNCPQYIQSRELKWTDPGSTPTPVVEDFDEFDSAARALIARSDTFFVASYVANGSGAASEGADVSHRGGRPGFIRIENKQTLTIPDYAGNNHFNTIGNFIDTPRAGLLFLDFDNGDLLTVTGTVELDWDAPEAAFFEGAQRLWRFHLDHGRRIKHALPLRGQLEEYSPNTLLSGTWQEAAQLREADAQRNKWSEHVVTQIVEESSEIKSVYLKPSSHVIPRFDAGQFLTVKIRTNGRDAIRTYTVSSAPADPLLRISVKRERAANTDRPDGICSTYIHQELKVGDSIAAKAPCGAFTFDASQRRPAVLLAGGIGITPMMAMARHALNEGIRTRYIRPVTLIGSASDSARRAFFEELNEISAASAGRIRSYWALGHIDDSMLPGRDYHQHGRISAELLQKVLPLDDYDFYLCGPSSFMQSMYDMLRTLGVSNARIFAEEFGPASLQRDADRASTGFKAEPSASEAIIEFAESKTEQAWSASDGSLLEFAEKHGFNPDFGCRSGQCGACKCTLLAGAVSYLSEPTSSLGDKEVLLCCAVPAIVQGEEVARVALQL